MKPLFKFPDVLSINSFVFVCNVDKYVDYYVDVNHNSLKEIRIIKVVDNNTYITKYYDIREIIVYNRAAKILNISNLLK